MRCFAIRRTAATATTPGAVAYSVPQGYGTGPAGGYTPKELATAYGYNPTTDRSGTIVATVDAYDDPNALSDLNAFDAQYHALDSSFPAAETSSSFTKISASLFTVR